MEAIDLPAREKKIHYLTVRRSRRSASAAVAGEHQALDRALYLTAAMTGLRQGELLALRWRDVDWTRSADPRAALTRARRVRHAQEPARDAQRADERSCGARAGPMASERRAGRQTTRSCSLSRHGRRAGRGALMRRYRRALKAAQLEPTHRFHDLRHTFGTAMAAAGVPMRTLQEWMGHSDSQRRRSTRTTCRDPTRRRWWIGRSPTRWAGRELDDQVGGWAPTRPAGSDRDAVAMATPMGQPRGNPGVFVELFTSGWLNVTPAPEELSPSELEWAEEAQAQLWLEWCRSRPL